MTRPGATTTATRHQCESPKPTRRSVPFELERGQLATTAVTRFELLAGARTDHEKGLTRCSWRLLARSP